MVATTFQDIAEERMVRTHDTHGVSLLAGNRESRRSHIKNRGTGGARKQYHKLGH